MQRRKRWLVFAGIAGLVTILLWANWRLSPVVTITWRAPYSIHHAIPCDLDGDGKDEVFINMDEGKEHLLRIRNGVWQAEAVPVPKGWKWVDIWYSPEPIWYPSALIFRDLQDFFWASRHRHGWQWQKLVRVKGGSYYHTDLDGDGQKNDLLVLSVNDVVYWYELQHSGDIVLRDKLPLPKEGWVDLGDLQVEQGKLRSPLMVRCPKCKQWWRNLYTLKLPDIDGDGEAEHLTFTECWGPCKTTEVTLELSRTGQKERAALPFPVSIPVRSNERPLGGDFSGDRQREVLVPAWSNKDGFVLLRFWKSQKGWGCEAVPAHPPGRHFAVVRVGRQDWVFASSLKFVQTLYRTPKGWRRQRWEFKGYIGGFWQDSDGLGTVTSNEHWLSGNPTWNWMRRWSLRLRDWGVPVPVLPYSLTRIELWRWNPKRQNWRREGKRLFSEDVCLIHLPLTTDLNGDGRPELLIVEEHSHIFGVLAFQTGRWWKRWWFLKLWEPPGSPVAFFELPDGERRWLVIVGENTVRALTLR